MSLYDFLQQCKRDTYTKSYTLNKAKEHWDTAASNDPVSFLPFQEQHPLYETHGLRYCSETHLSVPNFVGASIPRRDLGDREYYCLTMLTLFKPWGTGRSLKMESESWDEAFMSYEFLAEHKKIMSNLHIKYECQDAQDDFHAQFKKGAVSLPGSACSAEQALDFFENTTLEESLTELQWNPESLDTESPLLSKQEKDRRRTTMEIRNVLSQTGWLTENPGTLPSGCDLHPEPLSLDQLGSKWKADVMTHRDQIRAERNRNLPLNSGKSTGQQGMHAEPVNIIDKSYLERKAHSPMCKPMIDAIVEDTTFKLNREQERAFRLIANHAVNPYSEQLKMYVGGMGGTGKTQVLRAVIEFFNQRNESHRFVVVAPTGSAAALIAGSTYHSMLGFDHNGDENLSMKKLAEVKTRLKGVDYIFFDEVSMLSCRDMYSIGVRLSRILNDSETPFGGLNMIFAGDFAQLAPVAGGEGSSLYSRKIGAHSTSYNSQITAVGKALWHQVTLVVILRVNMRQSTQTSDDALFRCALENMRFKACTPEDITFLRTRISSLSRTSVTHPDFRNVSIITARNAHRDEINRLGTIRFAADTGQSLHEFYSDDTVAASGAAKLSRSRTLLTPGIQDILWNLPPKSTDHISGKLTLVIGLPVMIRLNTAVELYMTKGQEAVVHSWQEAVGNQGQRVLDTLFVKLVNPPQNVQLAGLPLNVVPLTRSTTPIQCFLPDGTVMSVSRTQIDILPNYAMSDYTSQGKGRRFNVVDLQNSSNHHSYYTALSRSYSAAGTLILQGFDPKKITGGASGDLRQEFRELDLLDDITYLRYEGRLPPGVYGDRRNVLIETYRKVRGKAYIPSTVHPALRWSQTDPFLEPVCEDDWHIVEKPKSDKRKLDGVDEVNQPPLKKTKLESDDLHNDMDVDTFHGPIWNNNSCAFDAVVAILCNIWRSDPELWTEIFEEINSQYLRRNLAAILLVDNSISVLNEARDAIRTALVNDFSNVFAMGMETSPQEILARLLETRYTVYSSRPVCNNGHKDEDYEVLNESCFIPRDMDGFTGSLQRWFNFFQRASNRRCRRCGENTNRVFRFECLPPLIAVDLQPSVTISHHLQLSSVNDHQCRYKLKGVIYYGAHHFTSRILSDDNTVWFYDGLNGQSMIPEGEPASLDLAICGARSAIVAVYTRE